MFKQNQAEMYHKMKVVEVRKYHPSYLNKLNNFQQRLSKLNKSWLRKTSKWQRLSKMRAKRKFSETKCKGKLMRISSNSRKTLAIKLRK